MALGIITNLGTAGLRFATAFTGIASPQSMLRIISGEAHIGSDGLIVDRLLLGVMNIVVREVYAAGGFADTEFTIYGVEQVSGTDTGAAIAGRGFSDAAAKTAVAAASSTYAGLSTIGVAR